MLNLKPHDYLSARRLADHLKVDVITQNDVPGFDKGLIQKLHNHNVWSAVTLFKDGQYTIISNLDHSETRQESDLFHELAHIICGHDMSGFVLIGNVYLRNYNQEQENEAEWLGGCLHIPRKSLEWSFRNNISPQDICINYSASNDMLSYRINVTGIKYQYKYYTSKYLNNGFI